MLLAKSGTSLKLHKSRLTGVKSQVARTTITIAMGIASSEPISFPALVIRCVGKGFDMSTSSTVFYTLLFVLGYLVAPTTLVWGWMRWIKQGPQLWTISSTLSFLGFLLASASALFALWMMAFALGGGFEHTPNISYYSPNYSLFYQCIRRGSVLALLAIVFAVGGVWRRSRLRWQAPVSAVGILAFWLLATTWP